MLITAIWRCLHLCHLARKLTILMYLNLPIGVSKPNICKNLVCTEWELWLLVLTAKCRVTTIYAKLIVNIKACTLVTVVYNLVTSNVDKTITVWSTVTVVVAPPPATRCSAEDVLVDAVLVGVATRVVGVTRHNLSLSILVHHSEHSLHILALAHVLKWDVYAEDNHLVL